MSEMNRREALTLIALSPFAVGATSSTAQVVPPPAPTPPPAQTQQRKFFTPHEYALAVVLADLILPADERSGSASSAGTVDFIDFMLVDEVTSEGARVQVRGGLAWMDLESKRRYQRPFLQLAPAEQTAILDDIAWPARAKPEFTHGVSFFSRFRDMVASGFWSSQVGVRDLRYIGNVPHMWNGCPPEALQRLGVSYTA
ncbi:MAG: gluconate 2-dehydrogenase subunit 3 family protein [Gemmatimonadetes bacterium]|nr:gluconate 2-dehydrogenase subunit 3 family protein [Gemmatimonadota bacterium]